MIRSWLTFDLLELDTMPDDLICPICKQKGKPIDNTVGTIGFDCEKHD